MKDDNKKSMDASSTSAENVEKHLQALEKIDDVIETLYYSQEQPFSSEELGRLINEERLNELLAQSDAFLNRLNSELGDFDEDSSN